MTLQDYTTEELKAELRRRAAEERKARTAERRRMTEYNYAEGTVIHVSGTVFSRTTYDVKLDEADAKRLGKSTVCSLRPPKGVRRADAPEVGDRVRLKGRITRSDPTGFMWGNAYIHEIIKDN